jgi:hypothetical protein
MNRPIADPISYVLMFAVVVLLGAMVVHILITL